MAELRAREEEAGSAGAEHFEHGGVTRRIFLSYVSMAISGFIGVIAGIPIIGYLVSPLSKQEAASWVTLGKASEFKGPEPKFVTFSMTRRDGWTEVQDARACWVVAQEGGTQVVFNGRCTHLGCAYSWQTGGEHAERFYCPCHGGVYDREGTVLDGPPPRGLDRLVTKVENEQLMVLFQDYRLGSPAKEPL